MSILSEIERLHNNVINLRENTDAIFEAIANKGVEVPSGSKLDDCPGLISSISGGGGDGGLIRLDFIYPLNGTETIVLENEFKKSDISIKCSFVMNDDASNRQLIRFCDENNVCCSRFYMNNSYFIVDNIGNSGMTNSYYERKAPFTHIMYQGETRGFVYGGTGTGSAPYDANNNIIRKIEISSFVGRITFFEGNAIYTNANKIMDLEPFIDLSSNEKGFIDNVSGHKYILNCRVF